MRGWVGLRLGAQARGEGEGEGEGAEGAGQPRGGCAVAAGALR